MPRSMGTFSRNLTLNGVVCDECNQYFGNSIDFMLARGSAAALLRLTHGVKPAEKAREIRRDRIRVTLGEGYGELTGLILELLPEGGELVAKPVAQVGLRRSIDEPFTFISEEELTRGDELPVGPYPERCVMLHYDSPATQERLVALLQTRGVTLLPESQPGALPEIQPGGRLPVQVSARFDRLVHRCAAKISLNYLAHCHGRDLVLESDFDPIRRFIRWDESALHPLVALDDQPILADDHPRARQTNGHLVTVDWALDRRSIVGQVSLFNHARYRVSLARNYSGLWRPICRGHHFNIVSGRVDPLFAPTLVYTLR
jgi:hypothetical protein